MGEEPYDAPIPTVYVPAAAFLETEARCDLEPANETEGGSREKKKMQLLKQQKLTIRRLEAALQQRDLQSSGYGRPSSNLPSIPRTFNSLSAPDTTLKLCWTGCGRIFIVTFRLFDAKAEACTMCSRLHGVSPSTVIR